MFDVSIASSAVKTACPVTEPCVIFVPEPIICDWEATFRKLVKKCKFGNNQSHLLVDQLLDEENNSSTKTNKNSIGLDWKIL